MVILVALVLAISSCVKKDGAGVGNDEENSIFAVVNGKEIRGKEILEKIKNDLAELNRNAYEIKRRATEEIIQTRILEEEAKRQGSTMEKLFSQFDSLKEKDVSPADIQNFLKQRNINEGKLTKQEKESIPQILKMQRVYEARQRYVQELRGKASVQFKIQKPVEKPVEVSVGHGPSVGPGTAKVTIVEFSDFQCPFCARGRQRVDEIKDKYKDKVKIHFRNFPLESIHPNAFHAAEAAECALDQGKFWEYHNMLFENQSKLDEKSLLGFATELKLDTKAFEACLKSGTKGALIRKDMEDGNKVGVNSTPSFFVNGHAVRGAQPLEAFSEIIDDELASK